MTSLPNAPRGQARHRKSYRSSPSPNLASGNKTRDQLNGAASGTARSERRSALQPALKPLKEEAKIRVYKDGIDGPWV